MTLTYKDAGVDQEKAGKTLSQFAAFLKTRPKSSSLLSGIGPYASCFSLKDSIQGMQDPVLVTCCDGVGTKAKLALDWGDITTLGEDLVAMNVNDLLCVGAKPLVFLDYFACGQLDPDQLLTLLKSIQNGCEISNCVLAGGETAEMPGIYEVPDFDLGGFSVGMVDRKNIIGPEKIQIGDELWGIESSGAHSNGYSLIRKVIEKENISPTEKVPFSSETWKDVLLRPTRIYVPDLTPILDKVSGLAHITGGGLFENLPRILKSGQKAVIHAKSWPFSPLFSWLQEKAGLSTQELLTTFNCGVGMIVAVRPENAGALKTQMANRKLKLTRLGEVAATNDAPFVEWV